jgi:hypothetical protein
MPEVHYFRFDGLGGAMVARWTSTGDPKAAGSSPARDALLFGLVEGWDGFWVVGVMVVVVVRAGVSGASWEC